MACTARTSSVGVTLVCVMGLIAWQRETEQAELAWARTALERNPQLEVIASDPQAGVFTVRERSTGELRLVRLDELAAAPNARR